MYVMGLGRVECAMAGAPAPPDLRTISPYLIFSVSSGYMQKLTPVACFATSSTPLRTRVARP
jgi:hypothetical protein